MGLFVPAFEGHLTVDPLPEDFATLIQRRVESGLLMPGRRDRADYQVTSRDRSGLTFVARGLLTTYNVGLNDVTVGRSGANRIRYQVCFWGWTQIAVAHGLLLGALLASAFALYPPMRPEIAGSPHGVWLFWGMAAFWCLIWPWLLSALHKPHAEKALRRILGETLSGAPSSDVAEGGPSGVRGVS
jgi:hypothetical protein